jgi:hypothetical protein
VLLMQEVRSAVRVWLESKLPGFRVEERFRYDLLSSTRAHRTRITGDPVRYAEILYVPVFSSFSGTMISSQESPFFPAYNFDVFLYLGYRDHEDYMKSSQKEWDELLEGDSGILPALRNGVILDVGGKTVILQGLSVDVGLLSLDPANRDLVHTGRIRLSAG